MAENNHQSTALDGELERIKEDEEDVIWAVWESVEAGCTASECERVIVHDYMRLTGRGFSESDLLITDFLKLKAPSEQHGALLIAKATLILAVETRRLRWEQSKE